MRRKRPPDRETSESVSPHEFIIVGLMGAVFVLLILILTHSPCQ